MKTHHSDLANSHECIEPNQINIRLSTVSLPASPRCGGQRPGGCGVGRVYHQHPASTSSTLRLHHLPQRPRGAAGAPHCRRHPGLCGQSPASAPPPRAGDRGEEPGRTDYPVTGGAAVLSSVVFSAGRRPVISSGCYPLPLVRAV